MLFRSMSMDKGGGCPWTMFTLSMDNVRTMSWTLSRTSHFSFSKKFHTLQKNGSEGCGTCQYLVLILPPPPVKQGQQIFRLKVLFKKKFCNRRTFLISLCFVSIFSFCFSFASVSLQFRFSFASVSFRFASRFASKSGFRFEAKQSETVQKFREIAKQNFA